LDAWPNRLLSVVLFTWALWLAVLRGYSFVGVFSRRLDEVFVKVLRKWHAQLVFAGKAYAAFPLQRGQRICILASVFIEVSLWSLRREVHYS
jgi:hypothetical protein